MRNMSTNGRLQPEHLIVQPLHDRPFLLTRKRKKTALVVINQGCFFIQLLSGINGRSYTAEMVVHLNGSGFQLLM